MGKHVITLPTSKMLMLSGGDVSHGSKTCRQAMEDAASRRAKL